jgi:tRNA A-37 threonylcarbamoyl transferase component Bud32
MNKPAPLSQKRLSFAELEKLSSDGKILEADSRGPKVWQLADGLILKIFRQRRLLSSATLFPYAIRFIKNAQRLDAYGIPTVRPLQYFSLPGKRTTAVLYRPLPGYTIAQLVRNGTLDEATIREMASFIRMLHEKGIYFRSLHVGNIVRTSENKLGLIDIADMSFQRKPLSSALIKRNFQHFKRQLDSFCKHYKCEFPWRSLLDAYEAAVR